MKKMSMILALFAVCAFMMFVACDGPSSSDKIQQQQQETILKEAAAQTGMPSIKNFRERKILKDILELRDQEGLLTYTYLENLSPVVVPGHTALGGKLTYLGECIGYGIPYATQYTNPQKAEWHTSGGWVVLPQADPNALFSPQSAEGTWLLMKAPDGKGVFPVYVEPRVLVAPFKLRLD